MNRYALPAALAAYVLSIVAANVLTDRYGMVAVGFGLVVTAGTFAAGAALLARDLLREAAGDRWRWWIAAAIAAGALLSWMLATPGLALASAAAFALAELVDTAVYEVARRRGWTRVQGILTSNAVSGPVDTFTFLWLAPLFPVTAAAMIGQTIAKWLWATCLPVCAYLIATTARSETPA